MSKRTYDACGFIAQIGLPSIGTLYFAMAVVWSLPAVEEVMASVLALDTIVGVFLSLIEPPSDGQINVAMNEGVKMFTLELDKDPEQLEEMTQVVFKVNADSSS